MTNTLPDQAKSTIRLKFFESLFGAQEGIFCVASTEPVAPKSTFEQVFFKYPKDRHKIEDWVLKREHTHNLYFCVNLLDKPQRKKSACLETSIVWADLDAVLPESLTIPPSIVVETSPGRYQGYWRLSVPLPAFQAEEYSKRIAYASGADPSGWDLTQLMRIPFTMNWKYNVPHLVDITAAATTIEIKPLLFEALPSTAKVAGLDVDIPQSDEEPEHIIFKYAQLLRIGSFAALYTQEPDEEDDWSAILWRLLHELFKVGMSNEEVFVIARSAACNKYARDGRPLEHLWKDVLKCGFDYAHVESIMGNIQPISMPPLVGNTKPGETFIDTYRAWAEEATDAVPAFHDMAIFIVLSAIVGSSVKLETSAGGLVPNLWGMILGDSTLTRKTTAMRMAIDFLLTIDPALYLATDGTAEGLLTGLTTRPNKSSIFHKDEVSGFFDSMNRKDYMAGLQETLTALYDVPPVYTRRLRKETITIESPAFVFLAGGVTDRVCASIDESYILSGFLPRFVAVSAEGDANSRRALGPPTNVGIQARAKIASTLADLYEQYAIEVPVRIGGQLVSMPRRVSAVLTDEAWKTNAAYEDILLNEAKNSIIADLALPTFNRLSRSLLKMAMILAATRQQPVDSAESGGAQITVEQLDIENAAWYIQEWGKTSVHLMLNAGRSASEKLYDKIQNAIAREPGIARSALMRNYKMDSRVADLVMRTLEDRGRVRSSKLGKGTYYFPL